VYADAAAHGVAAGSVVYDTSGGEAQYVARDDMAGVGGGDANYEVVDDDSGAAPRPGVLGNGAVAVGARAQLPDSATSNAIYDEANQLTPNTGNNAIYEMGPESEQQGQQQRGRTSAVVVHAPPAYAGPAKTTQVAAG
jgi:hypothetical protein